MAVDILRKRFGNTQEIIDLHYSQLINIPIATSKVNSLRCLLDGVDQHIRSLEVLEENVNQDIVVSIVKSKLPEDVLVHLEIQNGTDKRWTVRTLMEKLYAYIVARERALTGASKQRDNTSSKTFNARSFTHTKAESTYYKGPVQKTSTQALVSTSRQQRKPVSTVVHPIKRCRYCNQNHWSDECTTYKTISERKDRIKGSCFRCLKEGHLSLDCKSNKKCVYCDKMNAHHRSLCPKKFTVQRTISNMSTDVISDKAAESDTMTNSFHVRNDNGLMSMNEMVLMQTALTKIKNPSERTDTEVRVLLDSGSHRSYISEKLTQRLCLKGEGEQEIHVVTFGNTKAKTIKTKYVKVDVRLNNGKYVQITANIVPLISGELQRKPTSDLFSDRVNDILSTVQLADTMPKESESSSIEFLIGNDYYLDFVNGEKLELQNGLYLLSSKFGWILSGRIKDTYDDSNDNNLLILTYGSKQNSTNAFTTIDNVLSPKTELEDFWNVESIGIVDKESQKEDDLVREDFTRTLKYENGRYQVKWPWKNECPDLPTNRDLALGRLKSTVNRMKNNPDILTKYHNVIQDQLQKGIIEEVKPNKSNGTVHYLAHHGVITPQKTTTKLRVVYDASAKTSKENNSLNDCLYRGPVMVHDLCGILLRFRKHPIAIVADIERAFLQIELQRDQRDVTRFLWLKYIDNPMTNACNIQEFRFCLVPFGVVSSPFLLGATIEHHLDTFHNEISNKIKNDIYVDKMITGAKDITEAKILYKDAKTIFNTGSMNLREWASNNKEVNSLFSPEDRAEVKSMKVLGLEWNLESDTLSYLSAKMLCHSLHATKREILKYIASIFDPLGLISPVILDAKYFLQELWNKHLEWDDALSDDDQKKWISLEKQLMNVEHVCIPRSISANCSKLVEYRIVCFCDAPQKAYAVAVYLHQRSEDTTKVDLIFSKNTFSTFKKALNYKTRTLSSCYRFTMFTVC
ncbi:uncharacterized protein LOC132755202 [Ruditapes philippinarum]|uniref:uncharacterized protein LOC132755202 n=1 Tax=Ruditapes philippinarum TaxID=129788 RepID=UPI00295B0D82|nr:uncharacterized protein LOC132755202 [Ruditapes philippinarum]